MSVRMSTEIIKYLIQPANKIQAKYKNKISFHLTICSLAKNATMRFISC